MLTTMPKRSDISKVLIIGSGPIVIGQACEFDYSGTQACKALRSLGYEVALINSNPATIMTDPVMADATYIEPLNPQTLRKVIADARPDVLLPNLGGQTALNLATQVDLPMIGITRDVIKRGEDRQTFKKLMGDIGIDTPRSVIANSVEDALQMSGPVVVRPAYTMGGTGGGFANTEDELRDLVSRGLDASPIGQVLVEESILGWQEIEVEVIRDQDDQIITVCTIENVDPVGVHTGDSFCVVPIRDPELGRRAEKIAHRIVREVGVVGGTNVQLAHDPRTGRIVVIEINPRTSRSSALASKATGLPIAHVSTLLAAGLTLDELPYWKGGSLADYTAEDDYVVAKMARWAFEKFPGAKDELGTQMKAVGEVMSIAATFPEAYGKAVRSLETTPAPFPEDLVEAVKTPSSQRFPQIYEALRQGISVDTLAEATSIDPWFLEGIRAALPTGDLRKAKENGVSDVQLAELLGISEAEVRQRRQEQGITHQYRAIPVAGVEEGEYYYSTYQPGGLPAPEKTKPRVIVLGGGPNRIGQGIEFDYCCVHASYTLRDQGYESIMVNCNPETVSTDYDTADRLYFEPLTVEDVLAIVQREQPDGVICQFGGQTPLNIAQDLKAAGVPIIGTSPDTIDLAEDRDRFRALMEELEIPMPHSAIATTADEAVAIAQYPVIVRPSYVLGGRGMEIIHDDASLRRYMEGAEGEILIDQFLENALECEADALSDGVEAFVPAVMEHVEYAGIHSGDSAAIIPSVSIPDDQLEVIEDYTRRIALALGVVGLINIQFAIQDGKVYVLEANPRASRTVPLVSKVCDVNMASLATRLMLGQSLASLNLQKRHVPYYGVKEAVFPFNMFPEVDPLLGPEMRSTGEVLGIAATPELAFYKGQEAAGGTLPTRGTVLITVAKRDRDKLGDTAKILADCGFNIIATAGTAADLGVEAVNKIHEGSPHALDLVEDGKIDLIINTPAGPESEHDDSAIRKAAIRRGIPYITTTAAARLAARGIAAQRAVRPLQGWHQS